VVTWLPACSSQTIHDAPRYGGRNRSPSLKSGNKHTTRIWNAETGEHIDTLPAIARINSLAFSPDGRLLALETQDGIVLFRATKPFDELARLTTIPDHGTGSFRFSRDSRQLAVQTTGGQSSGNSMPFTANWRRLIWLGIGRSR